MSRHAYRGTRARVTLLNGKEITAKTVIVTGGPLRNSASSSACSARCFRGAFTRQLNDKEMKYFEGVKPWGCTAGRIPPGPRYASRPTTVCMCNGFSYAAPHHVASAPSAGPFPSCAGPENRFPEIKHVNFEFIYGGMIMTMNLIRS